MKNAVRSLRTLPGRKMISTGLSADSHKKRSGFVPFLFMLLGLAMLSNQANAQNKFWSTDIQAGDRFGFAVAQNGTDAIVGAHGENTIATKAGAAYVFTFDGTEYVQEDKLTAGGDGEANDKFGWAVDIYGDYAIVGAPYENDKGFGTGVAYIFKRTAGVWSPVATLRPADLKSGHFFGYSVAISGDYAIVGALGDDDSGDQSGAVYVYHLSGGVWSFSEKIYAGDAGVNDYFGFSVDIDGDYAVVGAHRNNDGGKHTGSAYIFHLSGGTFTQQAELNASDAMALDSFGYQVAISGERVIIGAPGVDDNGSNAGAAYVFHRSGAVWSEEDKLLTSDGQADDYFGWSVSISGDLAFIGAWGDDDAGNLQGAAYSFARTGGSWIEQDKFTEGGVGISMQNLGFDVSIADDYAIAGGKADDEKGPNSGAAFFYKVNDGVTCLSASNGDSFDRLGHSTDINGDLAIAGSESDETSLNLNSTGSAYIYMKSGLSWAEVINIKASDAAIGDHFGWSVGIDGDYAVVGAPFKTESGQNIAGAVYIFRNDGGWAQIQKLTAPTIKTGDFFGYSVKISGDYIIVGSLGDDEKKTQAGAAYIYVKTGPSTFTLQQKIFATDFAENDYFGQAVDINGSDVVVGAPKKASDKGAAYVFTRSGSVWTQQEKLSASDGAAGDSIGWSVAIAPEYVNVGAPGKEAAYVFHRSGSTWGSEQAKLTASDAATNDQFGWKVGITPDIALVGAFLDDDTSPNSGSAYVYRRSGSTWTEDVKLVDLAPTANEEFGRAVDIADNTAMIGIPNDNNSNGIKAGAVCFFKLPAGAPMLVPTPELTALETIEGSDVMEAETQTIGTISETTTVQPLNALVYPNPSKGAVTVEFTMESATPARIQVLNMAGQVVYSANNIQVQGFATERINLDHLTNGVYLINISNGQEQIVRKLILSK